MATLAQLLQEDSELDVKIKNMQSLLNDQVSAASRKALLSHYEALLTQKFTIAQAIRSISPQHTGFSSPRKEPIVSSSTDDGSPAAHASGSGGILNPLAPVFVPSATKLAESSKIDPEYEEREAIRRWGVEQPNNESPDFPEDSKSELLFFGRGADRNNSERHISLENGVGTSEMPSSLMMKPIPVPGPRRNSPDSAISSEGSPPDGNQEGQATSRERADEQREKEYLSYADKTKGLGREDDEDCGLLEMDEMMEQMEREMRLTLLPKKYTREELLILNQSEPACCVFPSCLHPQFCKPHDNPAYHGRWNPQEWLYHAWEREGNPASQVARYPQSSTDPGFQTRRQKERLASNGGAVNIGAGARKASLGRGGIALMPETSIPTPGGALSNEVGTFKGEAGFEGLKLDEPAVESPQKEKKSSRISPTFRKRTENISDYKWN